MASSSLPRLFLHGWGQDSSIWRSSGLATQAGDTLLSLPGHGGAEDVAADGWVKWLTSQLPSHPVHLVGWSLGAMLALQLAQRLPRQIASLTLYAATPCFCIRSDWPHGVTTAQLKAINDSVRGEKKVQGLTRFARLMLHGEIHDRRLLRQMSSDQVASMTLPTAQGLEAGMELLQTLDMRATIAQIQQPTLLIHGQVDAVVPIGAGKWLADHLADANSRWLSGYGHQPWSKQDLSSDGPPCRSR